MPVVIDKSGSHPASSDSSLPPVISMPDGENSSIQHKGRRRNEGSGEGAFITQKGENFDNYKDGHNMEELEALVTGISQTSQDTLLLRKKKKMREVDESLLLMKEEYKKRMAIYEARQQVFEKEKKKFEDQVSKFEKFIQENDAKVKKAIKKQKTEEQEKVKKVKEMEILNQKLLDEENQKKKLIYRLKSLQRFREYLDGVLLEANSKTFEEVNDLLTRLYTLKRLHVDLTQGQQDIDEETDEVRLKFSNLQLETQNKLLMESSIFYGSQKILESLSTKNSKQLHNKNTEQKLQQDLQRAIGQILMAIKNLYFRCLATEGYSHIPRLKAPKGVELTQIQELDIYLKAVMGRINDLDEIDKEYRAYEFLNSQNQKIKDKTTEEEKNSTDQNALISAPTSAGAETTNPIAASQSQNHTTSSSEK